MVESLFSFARNIILFIGDLATQQMCFGFLHEIEVPKELED